MSFSFSINPLTLLELLMKQRRSSKEKVVKYIESIAEDADGLVRAWREISEALLEQGAATFDEKRFRELKIYKPPNTPYFLRLREFYNTVTVAMGAKLSSGLHGNIVETLANLIDEREITYKMYLRYIKSTTKVFLDEDNQSADLKNLLQSVYVLEKEAAKIHVLAETVRAL